MNPRRVITAEKTFQMIELILAVAFFGLFAYAVFDWLGWPSPSRGFKPFRLVWLTGALFLQPVAALAAQRSRRGSYVLLLSSMLLLLGSFFVAS